MQQVEHKEAVVPSTHSQWILPVRLGNSNKGFSVNIEVKSSTQHPLVPVTSVMADGDTSYVWTVENGKAKKVKVTLGNADAENQEILSGLKKDAQVIVNLMRNWKMEKRSENMTKLS